MSRDFIGSQQGRSFLKSPNRDRVTRMIRNDRIPQVNYMHVKLGFYEYCFTGQSVVSGVRYQKCRLTTTRVSDGSVRVDLIDAGNGYAEPSYTSDNPANIAWPQRDYTALSPTKFTTSLNSGLIQVAELEDIDSGFGSSILDQSYSDIESIEFETENVGTVELNQKFYVRGPANFRTKIVNVGSLNYVSIDGSGLAPLFDYSTSELRFKCWATSIDYVFSQRSNEGSRAESRLEQNPYFTSIPFVPRLIINGASFTIPYFVCRLSKLKLYRTQTSLWTTDMPTDPYYSYIGMSPGIRSQVACDIEHEMPDGILYPPPKSLMAFRTIRPGRLATPIPPFVKDFLGGPVPTCF